MSDWKTKLTSRKFILAVAAFLGSVAMSIAGLYTSNQTVAIVGTVCGILSAALYAFAEAYVDGKAASNTSTFIIEDSEDDGE